MDELVTQEATGQGELLCAPMIRDTRTELQEHSFRCMTCRARFTQRMLMFVPIRVFAAQVEALRCPMCGAGSKKIGMGERRTRAEDAAERIEGSLTQRLFHWLGTGERGLSSDTIACTLGGMARTGASHPADTDDFRRCLLLLEHVPELEARIGEMATVSPEWRRITECWPEITGAMREEAPNYDRPAPRAAAALARALALSDDEV